MTARTRTVALAGLAAAAVTALAALQARDEGRAAWRRAMLVQAGETGAFVRRALASRSDLLVAERLAELSRRSEVHYVLILDRTGRAVFHGRPEDVGTMYDSTWAKAALAATEPLLQPIPDLDVVEADIPLDAGAVLRLGFGYAPLAGTERWIWIAAGLATAGFAVIGLLAARAG